MSNIRKMQMTWELSEIVEELAKTFQQTSRRIYLENRSTTDLKGNNLIVSNMKDLLQVHFF